MTKKETKFKETEIGEIPEDWKINTIENSSVEIIDGDRGKNYPNGDDFSKSGYCLFLNTKNVPNINFDFTECMFITKEKDELLRKGKLKREDIVLTTRGTVGNVALYDKNVQFENIRINSGMVLIRNLNKDFFTKFLFQQLKSQLFKNQVLSSFSGTAQPQLPIRDLKRIYLVIPSISEQQSIAKILSNLDSKIELNQQMNKTLEAVGQAIFRRWFIDFEFPNEKGESYKSSGGEMIESELGEIPKGWNVSTIGDEFHTILGGTPSKKENDYWKNGTISWINSGAINDFPIIKSSEKITEAGLKNSAAVLMPRRTVVLPFVISLGKEVKISILGIDSSGNQSVLGIVENKRIGSEYIYYWIQFIKQKIYSWATGGAQQHINKGNVDKTKILIPSNEILSNFNKILNPMFEKILSNSIENESISKIRDSLLPKLMSGKIRVPIEARK